MVESGHNDVACRIERAVVTGKHRRPNAAVPIVEVQRSLSREAGRLPVCILVVEGDGASSGERSDRRALVGHKRQRESPIREGKAAGAVAGSILLRVVQLAGASTAPAEKLTCPQS